MMALENALQFSPDDLAENRRGRLSERQQSRIALQQQIVKGCGLIGGLLALSLLLLFVSRFDPLMMIVIVLSSIGLVIGIRRLMKQSAPTGKQVISTTGTLSKHIDRHEETYWYHVTVQGKEFNVNSVAYEAFVDGEHYTLYHLPRSPVILSVEVE
jgi:hypothetical protein